MKRDTILRWTDEGGRHPASVFPAGFAEFWDGVLARPFDKADAAPKTLRELAAEAREKDTAKETEPSRIILTGLN